MDNPRYHLDANESAFFQRQLESVDAQLYATIYPELKARMLIPTQPGVAEHARVYTYDLWDLNGKAQKVAALSDDIRRAAGKPKSYTVRIVTHAASFEYGILDIQAAAQGGQSLDVIHAMAARHAVETEIDRSLILGDSAAGQDGLLSHASINSSTGTADAMVDCRNAVKTIATRLKDAGGPGFERFVIALKPDRYAVLATTELGTTGRSKLEFMRSWPMVEDILPLQHAAGQDKEVVYPRSQMVLSAVVPMEFRRLAPEQRNLAFVVNTMSTTGGCVWRYPVAAQYITAGT